MKVRVELIEDGSEDEVVIRCGRADENVEKIRRYINELSAESVKLVFYKENREFFFPVGDVLFFETEGEYVYAHTAKDSYRIKHRLYELEQMLPPFFARSSKSAIINANRIYSITRSITSASLVSFKNSHKHIYVSRSYYKQLRLIIRKDRIL